MIKPYLNILAELKPMVEETSFADKLALTDVIIQRQIRDLDKNVAVAWSGGKDSTVVLHRVINYFPKVPVIFNDTGIEYPETTSFVHEIAAAWHLNLFITRPSKNFWRCIDEYGWPMPKHSLISDKGTNTGKCCYWMKEKPMKLILRSLKLKGYFTGVTATENYTRMFTARDKGTCYKTEGFVKIHPILYWTEENVWEYAKSNQLKMNEIYAKGADRCGCSCCTAFLSWEGQLSKCNPKLYAMVKARKDKQSVMRLGV